jgi:hypothetical protein
MNAIGNVYMRFTAAKSALLAKSCMARRRHFIMIIKACTPNYPKIFPSLDITPWLAHILHYPIAWKSLPGLQRVRMVGKESLWGFGIKSLW